MTTAQTEYSNLLNNGTIGQKHAQMLWYFLIYINTAVYGLTKWHFWTIHCWQNPPKTIRALKYKSFQACFCDGVDYDLSMIKCAVPCRMRTWCTRPCSPRCPGPRSRAVRMGATSARISRGWTDNLATKHTLFGGSVYIKQHFTHVFTKLILAWSRIYNCIRPVNVVVVLSVICP